jgi:hypothetical protein
VNLPFVSRGVYDDARADLKALQADLAVERLQIAHLTETIIQMKVTGATVRQAVGQNLGIKLERRQPTALDKALDENPRTRNAGQIRAKTSEWAERALAECQSDDEKEEVLDRVRNWSRVSAADEDDEEIAV